MSVAVVTGSGGLIGSEAVRHFADLGLDVVGVDNDMRAQFFGPEASTRWNAQRLAKEFPRRYAHYEIDIRDRETLRRLFQRYGDAIVLVVHTAAQPSHDWAVRDPFTDFDVNAGGTLNVLQNVREYCIDAPVIHCSTNKVYGDRPNTLPLVEQPTRWELEPGHAYYDGIAEDMSIDTCLHSIFGASKVAADVMVQEYGRYFGMKTVCFRGGTLTGPAHSATELHGFLGYVMRCAMEQRPYTVYGYKGKQVRDAIHSHDVVAAFEAFFRNPRSGAVYNLGGGRMSNASVLEAIELAGTISGRELQYRYRDANRVGDHIWWIGSNAAFQADYPAWRQRYDVNMILREIYEANVDKWAPVA
jgi:CDP-paratose 2-epimerase